jgi:hypothetical protein
VFEVLKSTGEEYELMMIMNLAHLLRGPQRQTNKIFECEDFQPKCGVKDVQQSRMSEDVL